jgi:hypothetical protein
MGKKEMFSTIKTFLERWLSSKFPGRTHEI